MPSWCRCSASSSRSKGLSQLLETVEKVRSGLHPALIIHGIVLTMHDARNNLSNQVVADVRQHSGQKVYDTVIPRNVRVSEAPSFGKPVLVYDLKCVGSEAYLRLATEVIQREKELITGTPAPRASYAPEPDEPAPRVRATEKDQETTMADEGRSRLGRGLAALIGEAGDAARRASNVRAVNAACRSSFSSPIRKIRGTISPPPISTN